jgi:hypothetical protein
MNVMGAIDRKQTGADSGARAVPKITAAAPKVGKSAAVAGQGVSPFIRFKETPIAIKPAVATTQPVRGAATVLRKASAKSAPIANSQARGITK